MAADFTGVVDRWKRFHWVLYVFGAIPLYSGWRMLRHRNDEMDLSANPVLRQARRLIPTTEEYDGQKFWVRRAGRWVATPLFLVLVVVEVSDVIFAVDSIPAIFAITQEPLVGIKMLLIDIWKVPIGLSLAAIAACLVVAVTASLRATRPSKARGHQEISRDS